MRKKLIKDNKNLNDEETKRIFESDKHFRFDVYMTGIRNHVLEFNNFKNQILIRIFGYNYKRSGISIFNYLVN